MHSYMEQVSLPVRLPDLDRLVEERKAGERRPMRLAVVAASLAVIACVAVLMVVGEGNRGTSVVLDEVAKPKFVDWKKEDAGSDDMNLHLKVAESLAKADGLAQTGLSPVPEGILKMAQRAAEEQKTMPGVEKEEAAKPKISASLEKMFQQAMDEQHVEKVAKEGDKDALKTSVLVSSSSKAEAQKRLAEAHKQAEAKTAAEEKTSANQLLNTVSTPTVAAAPVKQAAAAPAPAAVAHAATKAA